jgi:hypothetical protein
MRTRRERAVPLFLRWVGMPEIVEEEDDDPVPNDDD